MIAGTSGSQNGAGTLGAVEVVWYPGPAPGSGRAVVTIGAYDGVHLGHRAVIAGCASWPPSRGMATAVVTFDRHPARWSGPSRRRCC